MSLLKKQFLVGHIREFTPAPPGYGEDPKHDAKETHYFIKLDKVICVRERRTQPDLDSAESRIITMQILDSVEEPFKKEWLGKHVVVTGMLTHQITAHHWTKVLIIAKHTRTTDARMP
jgi:hypothetical protein